jgi:hypothetical protein
MILFKLLGAWVGLSLLYGALRVCAGRRDDA